MRKLLLYERPVHLDYQDRVVYLGGKVFVEDDAHDFYAASTSASSARGLRAADFTRPRGTPPSPTC